MASCADEAMAGAACDSVVGSVTAGGTSVAGGALEAGIELETG